MIDITTSTDVTDNDDQYNITFALQPAIVLTLVFGVSTFLCLLKLFVLRKNVATRIRFFFALLFIFLLSMCFL
jgi:hypothetical protein